MCLAYRRHRRNHHRAARTNGIELIEEEGGRLVAGGELIVAEPNPTTLRLTVAVPQT